MDLSGRDAFRPRSRDLSGDKDQFRFISQRKLKWPSLYHFYTSPSAIVVLQNSSPAAITHHYPIGFSFTT